MKTIIQIFSSIWRENACVDKIRYILNAVTWQVRKKLKHSFVKKLHTGAFIKVYPFSSYSSIFYYKWPEKEEQLFIRKHRYLAPTFVDVGANVGIFSSHVFNCFKFFYLFEPSLSTFKALEDTCSLNSGVQWNLFNLGVADQKGSMEFIDEGGLSSTNRFFDSKISISEQTSTQSINVDTLDHLIPEKIGDIVLKVDVEGLEERVFRGANRIFAQQQAKLVMFERLGRTNLSNLKKIFKSYNYVIFAVKKNGLISTSDDVISVPLINLFAAPENVFASLNYGKNHIT